MNDYEELINCLREDAEWAVGNEWEVPIMLSDHLNQAADVIEKLSKQIRDCKSELCLSCGWYVNRHLGACDGCRWYKPQKEKDNA